MKSIQRRKLLRAGVAGLAAVVGTKMTSFASVAGMHSRASTKSAVVVGAGIAGLTAAYELQKRGLRVTVLESAAYIGGRMVERSFGRWHGPTHASGYFRTNREMLALAKELGIREEQMDGTEIVLPADNGKGVYPFSLRFSAIEAASIPGMTAEAQRALPTLGGAIVSRFGGIDPSLPTASPEFDSISVAEFVRHIVGDAAARPILDYAIGPVTEGWGTPVEEASCVPFMSLFAHDGGHYIRPNTSIGLLPEELSKRLHVRLRCAVTNISAPDERGRRHVTVLGPQGQRERLSPDLIVCAVPGTRVNAIVDAMPQEAMDVYSNAEYCQFARVIYVLKPNAVVDSPRGGFHVAANPDPRKRPIEMWAVQPARVDKPASAVVSLAFEEIPNWQASGQSLPEYALPLLKALYPAICWDDVDDVIVSGGDYVPYMRVGFSARATGLMRLQAARPSRLYFVGECVSSAHVGGSCASATHVANLIGSHWL